jgi:hypothetical protein
VLFAAAVAAVLAAAAVPVSRHAVDRSRTWAATRYLAGKAAEARLQAVRRSASVAIRFEQAAGGITISIVMDGNRNGVRTQDIDAGIDVVLEAPARLGDLFPGVVIGVSEEAGGGDPVRFGSSGLLSFTALGTSSSGTVYVRGQDGSQFAVRVLGATGRTRVLQYRRDSGQWLDTF